MVLWLMWTLETTGLWETSKTKSQVITKWERTETPRTSHNARTGNLLLIQIYKFSKFFGLQETAAEIPSLHAPVFSHMVPP